MKYIKMFLLVSTFFLGCDKDDDICLPSCIVSLIGVISENPCDDTANITQYRFQNSEVYLIDPGHCADDQSYDVINSNCEVIGRLGGFVGNDEINGVKFYENAEIVTVVWEK